MGKLLLFVALFTLSLTVIHAQDVTAKIVGEAGTKWEIDFDLQASGFTTWAKCGIQLDASTGGRELTSVEDIYGYVKISNLDLGQFRLGFFNSADGWDPAWFDGSDGASVSGIEMGQTLGVNKRGSQPLNPSIEAKIIAGPVYAKFDGNTYCRAERFFDDRTMEFKEDVNGLEVDKLWTDMGRGSGIIELGYDVDSIKVAAKISSAMSIFPEDVDGDGTITQTEIDQTTNINNEYSTGIDIGIGVFGNLDLSSGVYTTFSGEDDFEIPVHVGIKATYLFVLSEDISLEPYAGMELKKQGDVDPEIEIAGGINVKWPGTTWDYAWSMTDAFIDYWVGWPQMFIAFSGINLYVNYLGRNNDIIDEISGEVTGSQRAHSINFRATLFDDYGDGGMIPFLGIGLIGIMNMSLEDNLDEVDPVIGIGLFIIAPAAEGISPFVAVDVNLANESTVPETYAELSTGVQIDVIPHCQITFAYDGQGRNIVNEEGTEPGMKTLGILRAEFRFKYY
ncbi:MAG: hypothetical protein JXJ04_24785 [Spirochaetales bacterium]|nr:hypothetical protein [Spirochaetales bacterium]